MATRMSSEEGAGKKKLTLSVDEDVVKRAKKLGLNMSEITESVLRGFAFAPDEAARGSLYTRYKELFAAMQPLLRDYDARVEVARWYYSSDEFPDQAEGESVVYLNANGTLTRWDNEDLGPGSDDVEDIDITQIPLSAFGKPKDILAKFITAISKSKEEREEQIEELEMAKRIVAAIDATAGKPSRKQEPTKKEKAS